MKTIDERTMGQKIEDLKLNTKMKADKAIKWCSDNKEELITVVPIVIGCAATMTKVVGKRVNLKKEESLKELYCYDRSLGHYWQLRRKLTNKEWLEIDARKKAGERLADILSEMKVLK